MPNPFETQYQDAIKAADFSHQQVIGAQAALDAASRALQTPPPGIDEVAWHELDDYKVKRADLLAAQSALERRQDEENKAKTDLAKIKDAWLNPDRARPAGEADQLEEIRQKRINQAAGKGYVTDEEIRKEGKTDTIRADAIAKQAADRQAERDAAKANLDATIAQKEKDRDWDKEKFGILERERKGEITAKQAELELNTLFNDRRIQLENIQRQNEAATAVYQGEINQRADDARARTAGQTTGLGIAGFVTSLFKAGNVSKATDQDIMDAIKFYTDYVNGEGEYNVTKQGPRVTPPIALTETAAGNQRVGGVGTSTGAPPLPGQPPQVQSGDSPGIVAAKSVIQQKYDEWTQARIDNGESGPGDMGQFIEHLKATNASPEQIDQAQNNNGTLIDSTSNFRADRGLTNPTPPEPSVSEASKGYNVPNQPQAFAPPAATPGVGGITINVGQPTSSSPTQMDQSQAQMQQAQDQIQHASTAETSSMLTDAGFDPEVINQFQQKNKYDPNFSNPFLNNLMTA